jgi:hypothetical protein
MKIEHISREYVVRQIETKFQSVGESQATALGAVAEHLRAGCLMLGMRDGTVGESSVSSLQLSKQVYRRVSHLFPDEVGSLEMVREVIDNLQEMGDLARMDGNRVQIAPARRLELDSSHSLLVGGGPLDSLPLRICKSLVISGRSRIMTEPLPGELAHAFPLQQLEDWLGLEDEDMMAWATAFAEAKTKPQSDVAVPDGVHVWNGKYWRTLGEFEGLGPQLCRRKTLLYGNPVHEYALLRFRRGGATTRVEAYAIIDRETARKLQGALRTAGTSGEQFRISATRPGIVEITLRHPLPKRYEKLLLFGWEAAYLDPPEHGVRKIEFSDRLLPLLSRGFSLLGYELKNW